MSRPLTKNDFKLKDLTQTQIAITYVHALVSLTFWTIYRFDLITTENLKGWISLYYFLLPFAIVGLFFRNLRNFKFYLIWLTISSVQLVVYFMVEGLPDFYYPNGTAFSGLKALLPTLIFFQVFRIVLLKTKGLELIVTMSKGRFTMWEEEDNRKMTWLDVTFSLILMGIIVIFDGV